MSTPSDLTQSGENLVLGMVNAANTDLPNGPLSSSNVTLGAPTATGASPNTSVEFSAIASHGYTGSVTCTYDRLDISADVFSVLAPGGATLVDASYATIADLLAPLNTAYAINLQAGDISNGATALSLTEDAGTATIEIASTCLTYTGSLVVTITQPQLALSSVITTTALTGLTAPAAAPI